MSFVVVKDFNYSHDGIATERLKAGTTQSIRAELVDGLISAAFIRRAEPDAAQESVVEAAEAAQDESFAEVEQSAAPEKRRPGRPSKSRL